MFLPRTWNNGIMEYWNVDLKEEPLTTNMLAPMSRVIFPMSYLPKAHYSIIPVFQYSNCERSELSSFIIVNKNEKK